MNKYQDDFCAFILTHGRPDRVYTYDTLQKCGYTGKVYIVIDDEDKTREQYIERFGDKVLIFSKEEIAKTFDEGDNFHDRRVIIYARNACFELAKQVGCRYFIQLDDDYTSFMYHFDAKNKFRKTELKSLDDALSAMLDYYLSIPALTIAMGQGGDLIGGQNSTTGGNSIRTKRKAMNSFICSTDRPFKFFGRINEDVNTYTNLGRRGGLFLTLLPIMLYQKQTQSNAGGMTDIYLTNGTYLKSFYSVMYAPSIVKVALMERAANKRLHHMIMSWKTAVPQILPETYRKVRNDGNP